MPQHICLLDQARIGPAPHPPTVPVPAAVQAVPVPAALHGRLGLQPELAALPAVPLPDRSPLLMPGLHLRGALLTGALLTRAPGQNLNHSCQQGKHRPINSIGPPRVEVLTVAEQVFDSSSFTSFRALCSETSRGIRRRAALMARPRRSRFVGSAYHGGKEA